MQLGLRAVEHDLNNLDYLFDRLLLTILDIRGQEAEQLLGQRAFHQRHAGHLLLQFGQHVQDFNAHTKGNLDGVDLPQVVVLLLEEEKLGV